MESKLVMQVLLKHKRSKNHQEAAIKYTAIPPRGLVCIETLLAIVHKQERFLS